MNIDFDENPITEDEVIEILGNNYKKQGHELVWRCPACPGGDKSGDNLKFNTQKGIIKCFACNYGNEIAQIIFRRRIQRSKGQDYDELILPPRNVNLQSNYVLPETEDNEKDIPQEELESYYWNCHIALMKRKDVLRKMFLKHTILPRTAMECMIGYDVEKDKLVFPSKAIGADPTEALYGTTPNGAEYREYQNKKTMWRIKGYEPKICSVYATGFTMEAVICEGYKDAYNMVQLLKILNPEKLSYTAIFSVQNGTNSINANNCLQKSNWNKFDKVELVMDDDHAGNKAVELARSFFPKMIDARKTYLNGYNDVQKRFEKEFATSIDIEKALSAKWIDDYSKEIPI